MKRLPRPFGAWAVALALAFGGVTASTADTETNEATHDGLVLKEKTTYTRLYVRPGVSLAGYDQVEILDCPVAFRKNWERDQNDDAVGLGDRITKRDMDRIRAALSKEFLSVFTKELERKNGYTVIDAGTEAKKGAAGVLLLRPAIIDLDIAAPEVMAPDMQQTFSAGGVAMTLYLEIYDSMTGQILARFIDAQREDDGQIQVASAVLNKADADEILQRWAERLRKGLDRARGKAR